MFNIKKIIIFYKKKCCICGDKAIIKDIGIYFDYKKKFFCKKCHSIESLKAHKKIIKHLQYIFNEKLARLGKEIY